MTDLQHQPDEEYEYRAIPYRGNHYGSVGSGDTGFRKLIDGLLLVGVTGLVAVVWNMSNNISVLTTQVMYLNQEIQALQARVK